MSDKITRLQKEIGQRVMECRGENETQEQLAQAIGVSREIIQHWERGSRQIKAGHIALLAEHFGTSPDYLLGFTAAVSGGSKERAAEEYTGLSLESIQRIREAQFTLKALGGNTDILNWFFSSGYFLKLAVATEKYRLNTGKTDSHTQYLTLENEQQDIGYIMQQVAKLEMMDVVADMTKDIDMQRGEFDGKH